MLGKFTGSFAASKVAKVTIGMCTDMVNLLVRNGYDVQFQDTAYLLTECFTLCTFSYRAANPNDSREKSVSMNILLQRHLRDWLEKVFGGAAPGISFAQASFEVIQGLDEHSWKWQEEFVRNADHLKGEPASRWISSAAFDIHGGLDVYIYHRFQRDPSTPPEVLHTTSPKAQAIWYTNYQIMKSWLDQLIAPMEVDKLF
jgi:hypothetical protein